MIVTKKVILSLSSLCFRGSLTGVILNWVRAFVQRGDNFLPSLCIDQRGPEDIDTLL